MKGTFYMKSEKLIWRLLRRWRSYFRIIVKSIYPFCQ